MDIVLHPIGVVRSSRDAAIDDNWGAIPARIELDAGRFTVDATAALDAFSHIEVIFHFDRVPESEIETGARRPRGRADWPLVGIFAQRGKGRPNRLGLCACRILRVDGLVLHVEGLDAIDGTPVLDIKPAMKGFLPRGALREPEWAEEIMREYW
ncbi:MAG TPA: SAM-dependent methyltransferase [Rhizomicrobium sp.]|nr:SAM-dependent methyltransferase [Rhizomicrobium sp.]